MRHDEDNLQMAVAQYLDLIQGRHDFVWWHVPNGGQRNKREAGRFKAMGVKAGNPDIHILHFGKLFCIELKTVRNGLSDAQKVFIPRLQECGARVEVCRNLDQVKDTLIDWGIIQ